MSGEFADINLSLSDRIATVEIDRPPHNFFDRGLIAQLADAYEALDEDPACRVILLAANGKSFCAGADFGAGQAEQSRHAEFTEAGFKNLTGLMYREGIRLFRARKPVVCAVQGAAVGGGLGLALTADFRVGAPQARFAANFVKLGIHPGFGLTLTLPNLIGLQAANRMFLTGCRVKGEEALRLGLLDQLAPLAELRKAARALAAQIAGNAPLAVLSVRATMRQGLAERIAAATERELAEQQWLRGTEDAEEGIRAVAERRAGDFRGK